MKKRSIAALFLTAALLFSACGASTASMEDNAGAQAEVSNRYSDTLYDSLYLTAEKTDTETVMETTAAEDGSVQSQKLIRTMDMDAETDDLDALLAALDQKVRELGGYVENRNVRNGSSYSDRSCRCASLTVRIPADMLDSFAEHIQGASNVLSYQESAKDVTLSYVATESRMKALETEQARLLELLAQAQTMEDLLTVESRLTDVRTELEEVTSQLRLYDNLVDYGTVYLSVTEVTRFTLVEEETVWQRISGGFGESLQGLWSGVTEAFVFLAVNLPYIVVWGILIAGGVLLVRKVFKQKKKKQIPPPAQ